MTRFCCEGEGLVLLYSPVLVIEEGLSGEAGRRRANRGKVLCIPEDSEPDMELMSRLLEAP